MRLLSATLPVVLVCAWMAGPRCLAKEEIEVMVSYLLAPAQPLPEGLRAVAVINSGVSTMGVQQDEREQKWSLMAADMIEAMLQAGSAMMNPPLMVAKRSETQAVLREHDLALAGMVDAPQASQAGKLLAVQGLITSRITIQIDEVRGSKSTLDWMSLMGGVMKDSIGGREPAPQARPRGAVRGYPTPQPRTEIRRGPDGRPVVIQRRPVTPAPSPYRRSPAQIYDPRFSRQYRQERSVAGGGLTLKTKEVEEISRHLTVQCSFTLIDAATGRTLMQYSPPPAQKKDKKSPDFFFGGLVSEADLDPVDHFIGELVETSTREFVSMIVPVQMQYTYPVVGKHSAGEAAVRALRGDDYETAMQQFQTNLRKEPDEHETLFGIGVVSELMGKPEQALEFYRRALSADDVDDDEAVLYGAARSRLAQHMGRIIPPGGLQAAPAGGPPVAPAPAPVPTSATPAGPGASSGSATPTPSEAQSPSARQSASAGQQASTASDAPPRVFFAPR